MLTSLRVCDFRCFPALSLRFSPEANYFLGPNAIGKTSLLEAVCTLLRLQSPRAASLQQCVRFSRQEFSLEGICQKSKLRFRYGTAGRKLFLDDVPQPKTGDYLSQARITWFSNTDLELVRGGSSFRRRYLDFLGSQIFPSYLRALRSYDRALRARNFLLKEGRGHREISAYTVPLVEHGTMLRTCRASLLEMLAPLLAESAMQISGADECVSLLSLPGYEGDFFEALELSKKEETRLRHTTKGPHRDDFLLSLNHLPASEFASEGQQRTLALALKMAQSNLIEKQTGAPPVLLLDDIFGELDSGRRQRLLEAIPEKSQTFITTTSLAWHTPPSSASVFCLDRHDFAGEPQ